MSPWMANSIEWVLPVGAIMLTVLVVLLLCRLALGAYRACLKILESFNKRKDN